MQYNQNYRYQRRLSLKQFKIGCQSVTLERSTSHNAIRLEREKEMNYMYSSYPAPCSVRPAEPMSERSIIPCLLVAIVGNTRGVSQATPFSPPVTHGLVRDNGRGAAKYAHIRIAHILGLLEFREVDLGVGEILLRGRRRHGRWIIDLR